MEYSLNVLWDIFNKRKKEIVRKNESGIFTLDHLHAVLNWEVLDPTSDKYRPKHNNAINLSIKTLINKIWIKLEDFAEKKIVDIWCWFTWLPFLLKDINVDLTIVDPIFSSNVIFEIERNKNELLEILQKFDNHNYETYKRWDDQDYYYSLNNEFNNIYSDLLAWEKKYKKDSNENYNFSIIPMPAENITSIENNSIDVVFINHTITKLQIDSYKAFDKMYNRLKEWWKLYITESWSIDYADFKVVNTKFKVNIKHLSNCWKDEKTILILTKL